MRFYEISLFVVTGAILWFGYAASDFGHLDSVRKDFEMQSDLLKQNLETELMGYGMQVVDYVAYCNPSSKAEGRSSLTGTVKIAYLDSGLDRSEASVLEVNYEYSATQDCWSVHGLGSRRGESSNLDRHDKLMKIVTDLYSNANDKECSAKLASLDRS